MARIIRQYRIVFMHLVQITTNKIDKLMLGSYIRCARLLPKHIWRRPPKYGWVYLRLACQFWKHTFRSTMKQVQIVKG